MARQQLDSPKKNRIIGSLRAGASIRHAARLETSPDVNPIEPVWFDWKNNIRARQTPIETKEELKRAAQEAWDALTIEQINQQINSMPKRVAANTGY
ncbi:hypothetical protein ACEPAI_9821 [Sanghuangporus weigelae]